ncbi:MAG: Fe-S cluster assembly ATPase SufC [Deltaproteobacteria bacterium]|nr:Fe-S cluster assembly ATPase SufC [Deltaproteobacteria bacterium]
MLIIRDLEASINEKDILHKISLQLPKGQITALMGPNGSGKSTLARIIMGDPEVQVTGGQLIFNGTNLLDLEADDRARLGIFMAFQYPQEVAGVQLFQFLKVAYEARFGCQINLIDFKKIVSQALKTLNLEENFAKRPLNVGFSGGEKKKCEIFQLLVLKPELAILDETDSGLDIDSLRIVAEGIRQAKETNPEMSILVITHYERILNYLKPDRIIIMHNGRILKEGSDLLLSEILEYGYANIINAGN